MDISDVRRGLVPEINEAYLTLSDPAPIGEVGYLYEDLSLQMEALGICYLLEDADQEGFRERLVRAGHARRWFLRRSRIEGNADDYHLALTRQNGFLDALAAGHLPLAADIAAESNVAFNPQWEYEDDYAYQLFLMSLVAAGGPAPITEAQRAVLDRFEVALEGEVTPRLLICNALAAKHAGAFVDSFHALLEDDQRRVDEDRESDRVLEGDLCFWPTSYVFVEGLALLKAAELVGIPARGPFPRCPDLARLGFTNHAYEDYFEVIANS